MKHDRRIGENESKMCFVIMDLAAPFLATLPIERQRFGWASDTCRPRGYFVHYEQDECLYQKDFANSDYAVNKQVIQLVSNF